jgi:hypothetical protein
MDVVEKLVMVGDGGRWPRQRRGYELTLNVVATPEALAVRKITREEVEESALRRSEGGEVNVEVLQEAVDISRAACARTSRS